LRESAIDEQLRSGDVGDLIGCAEPAERNSVRNGLHVFSRRIHRFCLGVHDQKRNCATLGSHFASVGFCGTTYEVVPAPSFEVERD
jgi:hypothetical protein